MGHPPNQNLDMDAMLHISTLHYYFGTKLEQLGAVVQYTCDRFVSQTAEQNPESLHEH